MSTFVRFRYWKPVTFLLVVLVAAVAVLSGTLARPAQALSLSPVSASPDTVGATSQIFFQLTNQSANAAEEIRVDFAANTFGVPQTISATAVIVTGEIVQSAVITGGTRITINLLAPGIPPGGTAAVIFTPAAGITNPTVPGSYSISVSTEEEATPLPSSAFSIAGGQLQNLTATLTPNTAGATDVTVLLTFRAATNTVSGAAVSIGFSAEPSGAAPNEFTVPAAMTAAQVQVRAGSTAAEAANAQPLNVGGLAITDGDNIVTVSIGLPSGVDVDGTPNQVEAGRFIAVRFLPAAGIDNPTSTGTSTLTVSTSVDTAAAQSSVTIVAAPTTAGQTDLAVTKSDAPDPVTLGNNLTYTITVTNNGPEAATGVTLTDTLLGSFTLVSATPSQGSCSGTNPITCGLGNLASGASATVTMVVTPTAVGDIINVALVKGAEADPRLVNNLAIERARVKAAKQEDTRGKIEFTGVVQSLPQTGLVGTWKVQGLTVNVSEATEIKRAPQVGSFVKVKGILTAEGLIQVRELEVEKRDRDAGRRDDDDHRPGFGFGDRNHTHFGPFGPPGLNKHDDDGDDDDDDDRHGKRGGKDNGKKRGQGRGD